MGSSFTITMMLKTILSGSLLILLVSSSQASFLTQKSENEFEMRLTEHGTNFTQKVVFDKENNFVIYETPNHNGRVATKFIYDTTNGIMLEVCDEARAATFHRQFMPVNFDQQDSFMHNVSDRPEILSDQRDRIEVKPTPKNTFHLITIDGPEVDVKCVPEKYRKYIPEGYNIDLSHQVRPLPKNRYGNESTFTVFDPLTQKTMKHDDAVDLIYEIFEDILPPCAFKRRVKRQSRIGALSNTCYDEHGEVVARCTYKPDPDACAGGCDKDKLGWDCTEIRKNCHYQFGEYEQVVEDTVIKNVLICRHETAEECFKHIDSAQSTCSPCCRVRGCEGTELIPACKNIPHDDICPHHEIGCPLADMQTNWTGQKLKQKCSVDEDCETIMDVSGKIANSGVNCWSTLREKKQKKFCCNNRNVKTNVPICDGAPPATTSAPPTTNNP